MLKGVGAFALAVGVVASGPALAADPVEVPAAVAAPAPAAERDGFDWSRVYAGAQAGVWFGFDPFAVEWLRVAVHAGKLFAIGDRVVAGVEVTAGPYFVPGEGYAEVFGLARAGVLATERILFYGTTGLGLDYLSGAPPAIGFVMGGGGEAAIGDGLSVRSEVLVYRYLGEAFSYLSLTVGVSWYFGR